MNTFKNGYGAIPYSSQLQVSVEKAYNAWKNFCNQNLKVKNLFSFGQTGGYEYKDENKLDFKENFHVSLDYNPATTAFGDINKDFIVAAKIVLKEIQESIFLAANILEDETKNNLLELVNDPSCWTLRFLHYFPRVNNQEHVIGAAHTDKGMFTLHLMEDGGSLEFLIENKWQSVHFTKDEALFFPGMLGQYHSECKLVALPHRVVSTKESEESGRYSMVVFVKAKGNIKYDKNTFGPTQQQFSQGENIDIPFEEFKRYFIDTKEVIL